MAKREYTIAVSAFQAREALAFSCALLKRSQIEDVYFRRSDGAMARLRRQDTVSRLSCTVEIHPLESPETIVLDHQACRRMLELLSFEPRERVRLSRETWRHCQYLLHLDKVEGLGEFLTLEAETGSASPKAFRTQALKFLRKTGVLALSKGVDKSRSLLYTASITHTAPAPSH